jgi:HEAT repeat protein
MPRYFFIALIAALLACGGCGTKRDDSQAGEGSAAQQDRKRAKAERQARKQAEDEARAKEAIAKLQTADEAALIAALGDQDRRVRRAAIQLLTDKGTSGEAVIQAVLPLLVDHWKPVREAAQQLMVRIGEPAVAPLIAALGKDSPHGDLSFPAKSGRKPTTIRSSIKVVLSDMGEIAVPALIAALSSDDPMIRRNASGALGRMGPKAAAAVPALLQAHEKDQDPTVRTNALGDLGQIAPLDPKVEAAARKAATAEDERLKKAGTKVLENIEKARAEAGAGAAQAAKPAPEAKPIPEAKPAPAAKP